MLIWREKYFFFIKGTGIQIAKKTLIFQIYLQDRIIINIIIIKDKVSLLVLFVKVQFLVIWR